LATEGCCASPAAAAEEAVDACGLVHHAFDGADDAHVSSAATQIAAHFRADVRTRETGFAPDQITRRDQHARRAIAALQRVFLRERGSEAPHQGVFVKTFDGAHAGAVAAHSIGDAGARDFAVDLNRTGATDAVLASHVRAGEQQLLAQKIGEIRARRYVRLDGLAVDCERDFHAAQASWQARLSATACSLSV
jgi:hypothetical protein